MTRMKPLMMTVDSTQMKEVKNQPIEETNPGLALQRQTSKLRAERLNYGWIYERERAKRIKRKKVDVDDVIKSWEESLIS